MHEPVASDEDLCRAYEVLIQNSQPLESRDWRMEYFRKASRSEKEQLLLQFFSLPPGRGVTHLGRGVKVDLPPAPPLTDQQLAAAYRRIHRMIENGPENRVAELPQARRFPRPQEFVEKTRPEREHLLQQVSDSYLGTLDGMDRQMSTPLDEIFLAEIGAYAFPPAVVAPMMRVSQRMADVNQLRKRLVSEIDLLQREFIELREAVRSSAAPQTTED